MPNPFDQFDNTQKKDNPFDQFDDLTHIPAKEPPDRSLKQPALGYAEAMQKEASDQAVIDSGVAYKDVQNKKQLPTMWSPVLSGDITGRVRAMRDDLAGGYVFADPNNMGKMRIVTRLNDGTLSSKPFSYGDPQRDMTATERFFAGMGKGFVDTGRGLKQASQFVGNKIGMVSDEDLQKSYEEEQAIRERDQPLMDTGAGFAGNVAGNIVTLLAPSAVIGTGAKVASKAAQGAAQGSRAAAVLGKTADVASKTSKALVAPQTYKGAAALGATIGALAPTTSGEERALNTIISGGASAAIPAVISGLGKVAKKIAPASGESALNFIQPPVASANAQAVNQQQAEQLAQDAAQRMGFDFNAMDDALKTKLSQQVADAVNTESGITPEGVVKKILLEQEGFKPTRAMLTGKPSDYQLEDSLRRQVEGEALNVIDIENNANLLSKIKELAPQQPVRHEEFSEKFRQQLGAERAIDKSATGALYEKAAKDEGKIVTDASPLVAALSDPKAFALTKVDSPVMQFLKRIGKDDSFFANDGTPKNMTMDELTTLRAIVNSKWQNIDDATQAQLTQLRRVIDKVEKNATQPIPTYEQARTSRIAQGKKWGAPLIQRIFAEDSTYKGAMKVDDEDLFKKTFVSSTKNQLKPLWNIMTDEQKKAANAQLSKYIEEKVFSNTSTTSGLDRNVIGSAAKMQRVLDGEIGQSKLELMLGKEKADQLQRLSKMWREIQHPPSGTKATGSAPELAVMQRRIIDLLRTSTGSKIPFVGSALGKLSQVAEERAAKQLRRNQATLALSPIEAEKQMQQVARQSNRERGRLVVPFSALQQSTQGRNE